MQINLQHSRVAIHNIMKLIEQDKTDMIFIQEPIYIKKEWLEYVSHTEITSPMKIRAVHPL